MTAQDRVAKFRQMVNGDDGDYTSYSDMEPGARHLVDVLRRYEHARATGDRRSLAALDTTVVRPRLRSARASPPRTNSFRPDVTRAGMGELRVGPTRSLTSTAVPSAD